MSTRHFSRHEDDRIDYGRPWLSLGVSLDEWGELTEWAQELHGERLSRHQVYVVGCTFLGRCFILKLKVKALWRAMEIEDKLRRVMHSPPR